jgi:hypothetical protein
MIKKTRKNTGKTRKNTGKTRKNTGKLRKNTGKMRIRNANCKQRKRLRTYKKKTRIKRASNTKRKYNGTNNSIKPRSNKGGNSGTENPPLKMLLIRHGFSHANFKNYGPQSRIISEESRLVRRMNEEEKTSSVEEQKGGVNLTHGYIFDPPLDEQGVLESEAAGIEIANDPRFGSNNFVLCSAMKRSIETALFMFPNKMVIVCPFLAENTGNKGRVARFFGANQENQVSAGFKSRTVDKQLENLANRVNSTKNNQFDVDNMKRRVGYAPLTTRNNKYTKEAGEGNINLFINWFNTIFKTWFLDGRGDGQENVLDLTQPIPIVTHSHTISSFLQGKVKIANNQVISVTSYVNPITFCTLFKGYRHKKSLPEISPTDMCPESASVVHESRGREPMLGSDDASTSRERIYGSDDAIPGREPMLGSKDESNDESKDESKDGSEGASKGRRWWRW